MDNAVLNISSKKQRTSQDIPALKLLVRLTMMQHESVKDCHILEKQARFIVYVVSSKGLLDESLASTLAMVIPKSMAFSLVQVSCLPLTVAGNVDESALGAVPIIDDVLAKPLENQLKSKPEIKNVAVLIQERKAKSERLHASDLLLNRQRHSKQSHIEIIAESEDLSAVHPSESAIKLLAISDGGHIEFDPEDRLTLPDLLQDSTAKAANKTIVYLLPDGTEKVQSYSALLQEAKCIHAGLATQGLKPKDNVIFLLEKNHDVIPAFWACMLGGFVPVIMEVPSHFESSNRAYQHICQLCYLLNAQLIITDSRLHDEVTHLQNSLSDHVLSIAVIDELKANTPTEQFHVCQSDDIAFFCLTSGSSGTPKCVPMTHKNVMTRSKGTNIFNQHNCHDVYLNWLPFDHIGSLAEHIRCIAAVCSMVYMVKEDILSHPLNMLYTIDKYRITHTWGPNFIYALIRDALQENTVEYPWDLSSVKFLISGGEAASCQIMTDFLARAGKFGFPITGSRPSFGMAEVCAGITYAEPGEGPLHSFFWIKNAAFNGKDVIKVAPETPGASAFANLGRPIPGVSIRIIDQAQQILPEERIGHVQLKGDLVLNEYYENAELNAKNFSPDGWLDTGDLGFISDGKLVLSGRAKEMLIINGSNYYSHEIEDIVEQIKGVEVSYTAACAVRGKNSVTDKLAVFFHPLVDDDHALKALIRQIRQTIVSRIHLNPDYIIPVEKTDIPKTPIGKIQRSPLSERFDQGLFDTKLRDIVGITASATLANLDELSLLDSGKVNNSESQMDAPRNQLESLLVEAWQEVLGCNVGIHDNFFDLGGSSIKAVMVMNKFQEKIGSIFHPISLFDAPTIAELAEYFKENYSALFKSAEQAGHDVEQPLTDKQINHMRDYLAHSLSRPSVKADLTGNKNKRAIFILSPARSGSTLLRVILAGNPQLFSPPELYLLGFNHLKEHKEFYSGRLSFLQEGVIRAMMEIKDCSKEQAEQIVHELERQDMSVKQLFALMQQWLGQRMLVDKTPPYAFNPDILQRMEQEFADPLYIHLVRHPAGMIASFEEARVDLAVDVHGDEASDICLTARQKGELWWMISHQNIRSFLKNIPTHRQHVVKFEDLVTQPKTTVEQLCQFMDIDFCADMLEPQKEKKQRMTDGAHQLSRIAGDPKFHTHQGISAKAADRWKQVYAKDFLSEVTWKIARDYGYRFDDHVSFSDFQIKPDPDNRYQPFPLTDIQQAYWAGSLGHFELGGYSVHSYTEVDSANLDVRCLNQAWQKMINRHEMLRTIILPDGQQQILENIPKYNIRQMDLRSLDTDGIQIELEVTRQAMSHQVFTLDKWPLFDIVVSRMDDNKYRVHLSFDAILFDARSRYIIYSELRQFYQQPALVMEPFELSFRDYVLMEEKIKNSPLYEQSRDYWLQQIPTLPETPELPLAINPSELKRPRFIQKNHFFEKNDWSRLKTLAAQQQITPSCLLLTVFSDVIRIWNKLDSFTINLTAYNRQPLHKQVNHIIGDFTSVILLAIDAPGQHNFITRAHNLQKRLWNNINHNHFSGIEVLRELAKRNDHKPGAQMPVVFTSVLGDEIQDTSQKTTDWLGDVVFNVAQTPQIWFDHVTFEEGGGLLCRWNIVDKLFPEGLMDAMFDAYLTCLQRLLQDERAWQEPWPATAKRLTSRSSLEQRQQTNATEAPVSDELLHTLFATQCVRSPEQTAVIAADKTLSYQELYTLSNQIGHRLQKMGVQPNQLVAVVMEKGWQQVAAVLGILASGAAYLPVDPELPEERFQHLLEFGQVDVALTEASLQKLMNWPSRIQRLCVDDVSLTEESRRAPEIRQQPEDLAYVIFTSGSTGLPKGVMIDHRGAVNTICDINARFNVGPKDKTIALSALSFDLSVYDIFGMLAVGGTIVMPQAADIRNSQQWLKLLNKHQVTLWNTVPAFVGLLTEYVESRPETSVESLRLIMMSGDWIPLSLSGKIQQRFNQPEVISLGGATEASIWSILYPIKQIDPAWKSIPYGKPMQNQQFHVLNSAMEDCPVWVPGQLYIGGIGLAKGYWRDSEKTAKAFIIHPRTGHRLYNTGDLGRYLSDGNIEFLGREDFQVKIQGFRVEIGEIEAALMQHPKVKTAVIDAKGAVQAEKQLVAYFVPVSDAVLSAEALQDFLRQKLPGYMIPASYVPLFELPLSANGKVDRKALPEASAALIPKAIFDDHQKQPPVSDVSTRILYLVEQVLTTRDLAYEDNIFNFGATSIHMMRIINQMEMEFGFRPQIDAFYMNPTISGLMDAYEVAHGTQTDNSVISSSYPNIHDLSSERLDQFEFITDPEQRNAFKERQLAIRHLELPSIALAKSKQLNELYEKRRSHRCYSSTPIALVDLGELLSCLSQETWFSQPKYLYGSAGGLYPIQSYLYIKPDRVESLVGGVYYYNPLEHRLLLLSGDVQLDERIYNPHINRPIYQQAAFSLFFISQLAAIAPMYKESALHFSVIEAGLMSQLLEMHAPDINLGLCQIGEVDFNQVRHLFDLDETHVLVHSLVGGASTKETGNDFSSTGMYGDSSEDREEEAF